MHRSQLPNIRLAARPSGLKFRAPQSAVSRWDKSITAESKAAGEISILQKIGPENWGGYSAGMMQKALRALGKGSVKLTINSPGGDAFEGIAIYNLLREHPGNVSVSVYGMAASAASIIAMAGDRIEIGEASFLMIHSASGMVMGNSADMAEFADLLAKIDEQVAELYARRSGNAVADVLKMMRKETWLAAKDAIASGFADASLAEPESKKTASASMRSPLPALSMSAMLAASGNQHAAGIRMSVTPGVSGGSKGSRIMVTLHEQLGELRAQRIAKMERQGEINLAFQKSPDAVTDEMRAEFDSLDAELVSLDDQIRAKSFELRTSQEARPITQTHSRTVQRGAPYLNLKVKDQDEKFKGQNWTRKVIAMALAHNHHVSPVDIAQARWGKTNPTLVECIRMAAVPGGGSDSGEWGAELVQSDQRYTGDFIEFLYAMTVFDQLPLREIPAHVTVKGTDGAATGYWVGQSKGIPATQGSASSVSLTPLKVAALAVVSNELLADSSPAAETWVRDLLAEAMSQRVDQTFLSTTAASAGVSPAGILNGVTAKTSAGATADNIRSDIEALMADFITARHVGGLTFVTTRGLGLALQLIRNSLGFPEFPGAMLSGGTLEGMRLVTGDNVSTGDFILLDPREIWKIGDTGIQVAISREATIEQDSAPQGATDTPVAASANLTNMFQEDSTAIRLIRRINFQKRRTTAVSFVGDAGYGGVTS
jgi:ATP-dependent protease ClpP protease subunit